MVAFSLAGVVMAVVMGRHRTARGTLADSAAAAAAHTHTVPTSATPVATPTGHSDAQPPPWWRMPADAPGQDARPVDPAGSWSHP